ncbi:MAG: flagellar basal body P-ring protein FlgI [Planctomycetota bacterium]
MIQQTLIALLLGLVGAQDGSWPLPPASGQPQPQPQQRPTRPAQEQPLPVPVTPYLGLGGVEAPRQPVWASSSEVVRTTSPLVGESPGRSSQVRVRVRDLVDVRGQETNQLQGVGLLTGLNGTGDSGNATTFALKNLLNTQNINLDPAQIASNNVAVVWVQATLPPGVKPGRRIDARVSSIYDAEDLTGGSLVWCELVAPGPDVVYATASGPISTGAFTVSGQAASASRNHPTVGICAQGCKVEREVPSLLVSEQGFVHLDLKPTQGSFGNAVRIARAINAVHERSAIPVDAMTVKVAVPAWLPTEEIVVFLDELLEIELVPEASSKVVINERTGVVILGEEVRLSRGAITKGNLTVTIAETAEASQPGALSGGDTAELPRTDLKVEEEDRRLSIVNGASTLQEVVEVLNVLGATPRDMVDILQSMSQNGMLHGELVLL